MRVLAWALRKIKKDSLAWGPWTFFLGTFSMFCPEPWAISSRAHSYLGLVGTHVENERIN